MADAVKPSLAGTETTQKTRPEKPDQAKYAADLAAAQKEHDANMEKFVRFFSVARYSMQGPTVSTQAEKD